MQWQRYLEKRAPPAAGRNEAEPFNAERLVAEIGRFVEEARSALVAGGWETVKDEQPEEFQRLVAAFVDVDDAFSRLDERGVVGAIAQARQALMMIL